MNKHYILFAILNFAISLCSAQVSMQEVLRHHGKESSYFWSTLVTKINDNHFSVKGLAKSAQPIEIIEENGTFTGIKVKQMGGVYNLELDTTEGKGKDSKFYGNPPKSIANIRNGRRLFSFVPIGNYVLALSGFDPSTGDFTKVFQVAILNSKNVSIPSGITNEHLKMAFSTNDKKSFEKINLKSAVKAYLGISETQPVVVENKSETLVTDESNASREETAVKDSKSEINPQQHIAIKNAKFTECSYYRFSSEEFYKEKGKCKVVYSKNDAGEVVGVGIAQGTKQDIYLIHSQRWGNNTKELAPTHYENNAYREDHNVLIYFNGGIYSLIWFDDTNPNNRRLSIKGYYGVSKPMDYEKIRGLFFNYRQTMHDVKDDALRAAKANSARLAGSNWDKRFDSSEGLRKVIKDGKVGFVDSEGYVVIPVEYEDSYNFFKQGLVGVKKNGKQGYINKKNEVIIPFEFDGIYEVSDNKIRVQKSGKYAFYDLNGKLISDYYVYASDFSGGKARVCNGTKSGFMNGSFEKQWLFTNGNYTFFDVFANGTYAVAINENAGLVDKNNNVIIPLKYNYVYNTRSRVITVEDFKEKKAYFDIDKKAFVTDFIFTKTENIVDGKARVSNEFGKGTLFSDGMVRWDNGKTTASKIGGSSTISWMANYDYVSDVNVNGLYRINKNGLYGFANKKGELISELKYRNASNFYTNDVALVTDASSGKLGAINANGEEVIPVIYNKIDSKPYGFLTQKGDEMDFYNEFGEKTGEPFTKMPPKLDFDLQNEENRYYKKEDHKDKMVDYLSKMVHKTKGGYYFAYPGIGSKDAHYYLYGSQLNNILSIDDYHLKNQREKDLHVIFGDKIEYHSYGNADGSRCKKVKETRIPISNGIYLDGTGLGIKDADEKNGMISITLWRNPSDKGLYLVYFYKDMSECKKLLIAENTSGVARIDHYKTGAIAGIRTIYIAYEAGTETYIKSFQVNLDYKNVQLTKLNESSTSLNQWKLQDMVFDINNSERIYAVYHKKSQNKGKITLLSFDNKLNEIAKIQMDGILGSLWHKRGRKSSQTPMFEKNGDHLQFESQDFASGGSNYCLHYDWQRETLLLLCRPKQDIATYKVPNNVSLNDSPKWQYKSQKYATNIPTFINFEPKSLMPLSYSFITTIWSGTDHYGPNGNQMSQFYLDDFELYNIFDSHPKIKFSEKPKQPGKDAWSGKDGVDIDELMYGNATDCYYYREYYDLDEEKKK